MDKTFRGMHADEKPTCGVCGRFFSDECAEHGELKECHCGNYRPVVAELETGYRLQCDCTGSSTGKTVVPK